MTGVVLKLVLNEPEGTSNRYAMVEKSSKKLVVHFSFCNHSVLFLLCKNHYKKAGIHDISEALHLTNLPHPLSIF
jgi:hypothetical protein